jgi:hypothetical protein
VPALQRAADDVVAGGGVVLVVVVHVDELDVVRLVGVAHQPRQHRHHRLDVVGEDVRVRVVVRVEHVDHDQRDRLVAGHP